MSIALGTSGWLFVWGGGLVAAAILIWWRTARYDIKGAAADSVWQVATGQRTVENPTPVEVMANEIVAEATVVGKAKRTALTVAGHFMAQVLGAVALLMLLAGLVLLGLGWYWS
jgi:hypothetical protein